MDEKPVHFKGKDAVGHVAEAQARGIIASTEAHGVELPGYLAAATDTAKETALLLLILWSIPSSHPLLVMTTLSVGWFLWKGGRSAWLAWSRIERLHRVLAQEKWEIDHHRDQEKDELKVLYAAKGFEGKLLNDVVDVLMADGDRLLQVMVEEEMGLSLELLEHPLQQGLGAASGVALATLVAIASLSLGNVGFLAANLTLIGIASGLGAWYIDNKIVNAVVWNIGIALLSFGTTYFTLQFLLGG